MSNDGRRNGGQHFDNMPEARAGIIFESDWLEAEKHARECRTARVGRMVKAYARLSYLGGSEDLAIATVLADLRHCCKSKGLSFHKLDELAQGLYAEETEDEKVLG